VIARLDPAVLTVKDGVAGGVVGVGVDFAALDRGLQAVAGGVDGVIGGDAIHAEPGGLL